MDQVGSTIELPGSTYLYALAFLAIALVGFSSIVAAIRQTGGSRLSKIQVFLTRSYIEHGLLVVGLFHSAYVSKLIWTPIRLHVATLELARRHSSGHKRGIVRCKIPSSDYGPPTGHCLASFFYDGWRCARSFCECWRYS